MNREDRKVLEFLNFKNLNDDVTLLRNVETANFRSKLEEKHNKDSCDRNNDEK